MRIDAEDQVGDPWSHPEPHPLQGRGTTDDPFRPAALDKHLHGIAQLAKEKGVPHYCLFEESLFRIHPDGTVEWAHRMPPLRDNIAEIIQASLREWRKRLEHSTPSPTIV